MGRRTQAYALANNRLREGAPERHCYRCSHWFALDKFKITHGVRSYICLSCEAVRQRARERAAAAQGLKRNRNTNGMPRQKWVPPVPAFDDTRVDVFGLMCFATMPTPQQLIKRKAA